jgi:hypothetical protein
MTDISVETTAYSGEDRSWLLSPHGTDPGTALNVTLDIAQFPDAVTDGYIPSGTVLGKVTASGKYGLYDNGAADGTEVAAGILFATVPVKAGQTQASSGMLVHCFVDAAKLTGLDATARTDLKLVHFTN